MQLFGLHKDAEVLSKILDPRTFEGIVISDDAAVYRNFTNGCNPKLRVSFGGERRWLSGYSLG